MDKGGGGTEKPRLAPLTRRSPWLLGCAAGLIVVPQPGLSTLLQLRFPPGRPPLCFLPFSCGLSLLQHLLPRLMCFHYGLCCRVCSRLRVCSYGTGAIMAVPAHDSRDFEFATEFSLPIRTVVLPPGAEGEALPEGQAYPGAGVMVNSSHSASGLDLNGKSNEDAGKEVIAWLEAQGIGRKQVQHCFVVLARQGANRCSIALLHWPGRKETGAALVLCLNQPGRKPVQQCSVALARQGANRCSVAVSCWEPDLS